MVLHFVWPTEDYEVDELDWLDDDDDDDDADDDDDDETCI